MDPAAVREILLVRPYMDNPYQVERVVRALPYKTRVYPYYSNMPWLPFAPRLTGRVSAASEGYPGWLQNDVVVIANSDLQSAEERDVQNMRSALERGLPAFLIGGPFGLGKSFRLWHDLEGALPAAIPAAEPERCDDEVTVSAQHPALRALPQAFGRVKAVHPLDVHDDAEVLLSAGERPVLVASERFGSRQLILAVAEADGICCDGLMPDGFYGHPFYPDLMRACLTWLMRVKRPLTFESLRLDTGLRLAEPGEHVVRVGVGAHGGVAGAQVRCRVWSVDEGRMMSGGDTRAAELLSDEARPIGPAGGEETFELDDPLAGTHSGLYEVEFSAEMDNPPASPMQRCFAMAAAPGWNDWKGKAVDVRRFRLAFPDVRRARAMIVGRTCALQEGRTWRVRVTPPEPAAVSLRVRDGDGRTVAELASSSDGEATDLAWQVPALTEGDYSASVTVRPESGAYEERFSFALKAAAPPDAARNFQLVGHGLPGNGGDDEALDRLRTWLDDFGLDMPSLPAHAQADAFWDEGTKWSSQPFGLRRWPWIDAMVAAEGRNLWTDFATQLVVLKTHGASVDYEPTVPCVNSPGYEAAVRNELAPKLRLLADRPGMVSAEIIDEPHLYPSNICRCGTCLRLYRERFGEDMPEWKSLEGDRTERRWNLFRWLEDYTARAFETAYRVKAELAPNVHVHNVAIDRLFSSNFMFNGMHRWAAFGDEIYMACYPWSYCVWRGREQLPHSQTHWIAAWVRGLAMGRDIPWGVFMELWEHDTPNRWLRPFWSVGQFYALLAEGVRRMDTFLTSFGCEVFGISDERLREFGFEVNKVRPYFPLLAQAKRPGGRIAFMNPWCEWVMNPAPHRLPPDHEGYGYYRRYGAPFDGQYPHENRRMLAYELFHRVFPDMEQVDEQLLCEAKLDYQAVVVTDCEFLMRNSVDALSAYVRRGGVLVLDCEPHMDETGAETDLCASLLASAEIEESVVTPGLSCRTWRCGKGLVMRFSASLQTAYADALEGERAGVTARIEAFLARSLADAGCRSRYSSSCADVDAGLRVGEGFFMVVAADLVPGKRTTEIVVPEAPFAPGFAVNLTTGEFLPPQAGPDVRLSCTLDGYHGALYAFFPERPAACRVSSPSSALGAGESLAYEVLVNGAKGTMRGAFLVDVQVLDPSGRVHRRLGGPHLVRDGRAAFSGLLPVNAEPGQWTIRADDPISGLSAEAHFDVR